MMHASNIRSFLRIAAFRPLVLCGIVSLLSTSVALAKPITYTAFTITDGKLGNWTFHNARVYLTLQSDTTTVQLFQPLTDPTDPSQGTVDTYINTVGTASVTIVSGSRVVHATFAPHQLFASMDLGRTADAPHIGARGGGISSFTATGIEPAYPLGIEDGTIDWGDIPGDGNVASAGLQALPVDLVSTTAFSGRAWPCTGFPTGGNACSAPAPLHTDKGDFYLYLPYQDVNPTGPYYNDPLSAGFFVATLGSSSPVPSLRPDPIEHARKPISYHGYTVSDVKLGGHLYKTAQVYLSVDADAATAVPFTNGTSHGFVNYGGNASVTVVSGGQSISAEFDPGQIYVYFDAGNANIGFGSWAGNSGYPLAITGFQDYDGLVENSSIQAIADILTTPADAQFYTAQTASLATDLTNATTLSGGASSCVAFNPATSVCSNMTPVALKTDHGNFYMFEPYTSDQGSGPNTVNWGVFWSDRGQKHDE